MLLRVIVQPQDEFADWVVTQQAPAIDDPRVRNGREIFQSVACITCHTVRGTTANGLFGPEWVVTVDHKRLGIMYVGVCLVFLLVAGLAATLMRWQLAFPENTVPAPQVFNRLFTMHGTTMEFFVGIPIVFGFANYLVPLMIGTRDLAFPRLNAFGFWLFVIGFNLTFIPLYCAGILGMPRRIYTYAADRGWEARNLVATLGVPIQAAAILLFLINVILSLRRGQPAGNDPWDAWTLEWSTTSPPPAYNFDTLPEVKSRRPLWDLKHPSDPDGLHEYGDAYAIRVEP
jgi:heme/copper-type cytochrome/quinol oxidase subunit 1